MKSLGRKPEGARLERMQASPRWAGGRFRNLHPIIPGLKDPNASMPSIGEFLCGGERRVPKKPLPALDPLETWTKIAWQRPARDLARPLHGAARDRRPARAHRSGLGPARIAFPLRRPEALPARAGSAARDAATRSRGRDARSLRPSRLPDHSQAREARRAVRDIARRRRAPGSLGRPACAHHRARLVGNVSAAEQRRSP